MPIISTCGVGGVCPPETASREGRGRIRPVGVHHPHTKHRFTDHRIYCISVYLRNIPYLLGIVSANQSRTDLLSLRLTKARARSNAAVFPWATLWSCLETTDLYMPCAGYAKIPNVAASCQCGVTAIIDQLITCLFPTL